MRPQPYSDATRCQSSFEIFLSADAGVARFFFQQALADVGGLFALVQIESTGEFCCAPAKCARRKASPAKARGPFCVRISTTSPLASACRSGTIAPFTFAPGALMADFGVHRIGKIDRR